MPDRYLRTIRVFVGAGSEEITVEELYIQFRIRKEATGTPAEGNIDIYNLSEENEARIRDRGKKVTINVGYQGGELRRLFTGTIRRVRRHRVELDRVTRIVVGGELSVRSMGQGPRAVFIKAYEGEVPARTIVSDAINVLGLSVGSLEQLPGDATETDFKYNGDARVFLTYFLEPYGLHWYIEDGVVKLSKYRQTSDDRPAGITISERTGMIGTPTITDDGVRVQTLLDSRLALNSRVKIESSVFDNQEFEGATWKVVELTHIGNNREGVFESSIEGRPLQ